VIVLSTGSLYTYGVARAVDLAARSGYDGAIGVEVDPSALDVSNEDACLIELRQALEYCRRHFRGEPSM